MDSVPECKVKYSPHPEKKGAFKKFTLCSGTYPYSPYMGASPPRGAGYRRLSTWPGAYLAPLFHQKLNVSLRVSEMMHESSVQASQEPALHFTWKLLGRQASGRYSRAASEKVHLYKYYYWGVVKTCCPRGKS